jgi:hypothetical protein
MIPEEKAKELHQKFYNAQYTHSISELAYDSAKQSALLCVKEILEFGNQVGLREPMMYWQKVKQEIEQL